MLQLTAVHLTGVDNVTNVGSVNFSLVGTAESVLVPLIDSTTNFLLLNASATPAFSPMPSSGTIGPNLILADI